MTKTDVTERLNLLGASQLLSSTVSCGRGRLNFTPGTHCGWYSQRIDRRLAAYAARLEGKDDRTRIYNIDLCAHSAHGAFLRFLHQAQRYATFFMEDFYTEYLSELSELVGCFSDLREEEVNKRLYDLHFRHGQQAGQAIQAIRRIDHPFKPTSPGSFVELIAYKCYLSPNGNSAEPAVKLATVKPGRKDTKQYENVMVEILTILFNPHLAEPHPQVRTVDALEIMDIAYRNHTDTSFWHDQISERLDPKIGLLGILAARSEGALDSARAYRRYNKQGTIQLLTLTCSIVRRA